MWLPRKEPMLFSIDCPPRGHRPRQRQESRFALGELAKDRKVCLSPSSPHQEHFLQAESAPFQKTSNCFTCPRKGRVSFATQHIGMDLCSLHSLTELHSSAQYCIMAFTLACCFAIPVSLKRIL